ncbi:putative lipid-binding transport protein (Tim44 family)/uncharacterized tellurite resistance protein B-like protein [Haloferula luteola]|uniref:Putative lipid-binding transport protein (Tim44 family)/uncharacterized tellurite resistance protein B-like protein n=1 Tax=Haloferula luteola TaxID=595692 RepID=A0A840V6Y2_9BACT|nr:TIM44-like domain-containing protein [Haloferula luteola]MBB5352796.1 putative lipid-binding transport protein (Tim44 family)/uncharacterized tellurite resistance protein B-like protein [Haloferula luteola]
MRARSWMVLILAAGVGLGELQARAGGGGGFGGGGGGGFGGGGFSGGGGGSGGDGDLGWLIFWLLRLCIEKPWFGVPLLGIVVWLFYTSGWKGVQKGEAYRQGQVIRKGAAIQSHRRRQEALAQLEQRDPGFDEGAFLERVNRAFLKIQTAWCGQDLGDVQAFISDGVDERFSLQIAEQKEDGWRDHMENLQVRRMQLVQVESDQVYDEVTVRVDASARDFRVDLRTGRRLSGSSMEEAFSEYWSFIRRPNAKTLKGGGLIEGRCPNCGSPLVLNESAQCESCESRVKSGAYDWVLSEITQASEWQIRDGGQVPGQRALLKKDPGFSVQALEDKASVVFWRMMAAYRAGKSGPIRKMASDDFVSKLEKTFAVSDSKGRAYPGEVAVGAVETVGLYPGDAWDRALVKVRWSGARFYQKPSGQRVRDGEKWIQTEILVLTRKGDVRTPLEQGLLSSHCPSCGGSVSSSAAEACEYCGQVIQDGSWDWVLEYRGGLYDPWIQSLVEQSKVLTPSHRGGLALAAWLVEVMLADGEIDAKEMKILEAYAKRAGLSTREVESLIEAGKSRSLQLEGPKEPGEAREWLMEMAEMALADGRISAEETQALQLLGKRLQFSSYDIQMLIRQARAKLYQESRSQIRDRASSRRG